MIEEFMDALMEKIGNDPRTSKTYRSKIGVFYDFILLKLKETDVNYIYFLNTASKAVLLQSIEYYIQVICRLGQLQNMQSYSYWEKGCLLMSSATLRIIGERCWTIAKKELMRIEGYFH